jgi:hypothetical protein
VTITDDRTGSDGTMSPIAITGRCCNRTVVIAVDKLLSMTSHQPTQLVDWSIRYVDKVIKLKNDQGSQLCLGSVGVAGMKLNLK